MNETPPYRLFNAFTYKEKKIIEQYWPIIEERLKQKYQTEFVLDKNYVLHYDKEKATKDDVLKVVGQVFIEKQNAM